jgi:hypothetical protein
MHLDLCTSKLITRVPKAGQYAMPWYGLDHVTYRTPWVACLGTPPPPYRSRCKTVRSSMYSAQFLEHKVYGKMWSDVIKMQLERKIYISIKGQGNMNMYRIRYAKQSFLFQCLSR